MINEPDIDIEDDVIICEAPEAGEFLVDIEPDINPFDKEIDILIIPEEQ